jgi:hypothetical protein
MGNDLKDDQIYVCSIGNKGRDSNRWDRLRTLGIARV